MVEPKSGKVKFKKTRVRILKHDDRSWYYEIPGFEASGNHIFFNKSAFSITILGTVTVELFQLLKGLSHQIRFAWKWHGSISLG